ncbi:NAD-dependent deacetylase sirtuin-7 [Lasiosphaeria ovina]|uniref:protein acetyllysine N-acetyltransferase n=1 Tax=Lasiosphaeria ovina TaxID=92902 RepID=A0AAE0N9B5_9PEZI|nr:NAD-dependent deacetylase sirtuin-7 [Lasiosphaeria ovina]
MANTAPIIAEEERHEGDTVEEKAEILADRIRNSKHFIVFTGAGISTSAGIPDFRGPEGIWTLRAQGRQGISKTTDTLQAIPTPTHMALVELQNRGLLKYVVSQNCDGLHRRSGILPDHISELHGNSNREYCRDCGKEYIRDFRAVATYEVTVHDHRTGRNCALCGGVLLDSIVNFGEQLPADPFKRARAHAKKADLCLALGSSLTVTPANEIPEAVGQPLARRAGAMLAICNLQSTPLDDLASLRVYARTDELMVRIMEKLALPIPAFVLRRRLIVELATSGAASDRHELRVLGVDVDDTPVTFLQSVKLEHNRRVARQEPFTINFRGSLDEVVGMQLKLELQFMGHYGEPNLEIIHDWSGAGVSSTGEAIRTLYLLEYNPQNWEWKTAKQN